VIGRQLVCALLRGIGLISASLGLLCLGIGAQIWAKQLLMSAAEVEEWREICRGPGMDCYAEPAGWIVLAGVFLGLAGIVARLVFGRGAG
jgi:hypothetical protein